MAAKKEQWQKDWEKRIKEFAQAISQKPADIEKALEAVAGKPSEQALKVLANEEFAPFNEIQNALEAAGYKTPTGVLRQSMNILRGPKEDPTPVAAPAAGATSLTVLPSLPDDDSFIQMLKTGGELKVVTPVEVISAIKAALADRVGLFDLPKKLKTRMEEFAEENEEPVGKDFYDLRNMVTQRSYADILSALGIKGQFINGTRKTKFLNRLDEIFWASLKDFHDSLTGWQESWMAGAGNPQAMLAAITMAMGSGGQMPAGMMSPPPADAVRDAADTVVDRINKVFAGTGIPVARALAHDANEIKKVLEKEGLPAALGATNYEQMLKMLKTNVQADYVRMERNITQYTLAIMDLPKIPSGNDEITYLTAMMQLGMSIPWDKLFRTSGEGSRF